MPPYDLRLLVNATADGWEGSWIPPGASPSDAFPLTLPVDDAGAGDMRWYLEKYLQFPGAGDRVLARKFERQIDAWGQELFDALFKEHKDLLQDLLDASENGGATLTLDADANEVFIQPWEMMRDSAGPLVFQGVSLRRQPRAVKSSRKPAPVPASMRATTLHVLVIVSRPEEAGFIDPRNTIAPMLDVLEALPPDTVDVEYCEPPILARAEEMVADAERRGKPFHVVHFDGHGTYHPRTGVGTLAFEKPGNHEETHLVEGRTLGDMLTRYKVPLVLLEACRSSALGEQPIFGSVAPALLKSGVGSVVAFSHAVHVKAARLLVERFYKELTRGRTVGQALVEGRRALHAEPHRWLHRGPDADNVELRDWFIPQLYQVGADPALVEDQGEPVWTGETRRALKQHLHGFPPEPMYKFHGRARELLDLERAFRDVPAVLVSGMGGMGKTALAREAAWWWLRTGRFQEAVFHSFEQKAGADRVVQVLGTALYGDQFSAESSESQWKLAVDGFHTTRVLLVWDNFESTLPAFQKNDEDDITAFIPEERQRLQRLYRELTEDDPEGRLVVTCRPQETELSIRKIALGGLARPDSLHLLLAVLAQEGISRERYQREGVIELLKTIDNHPLSISLIAPHLDKMTPDQIREELRTNLERFANASAEEGRNRSLLASLEFSKKRLSPEARGVLPYLAWFEGGVFDRHFLQFAELEDDAWAAVRAELVATALIRVEELPQFNTPFLRFHPTLTSAARASDVGDVDAAEQRFIGVYLSVRQMVDQALRGSQPAAGMAHLTLEEANVRSALQRAFRRSERHKGWLMADTLRLYLGRSGRLRDRDELVDWVRSQMPDDEGLNAATCATIRDHAMGLLSHGKKEEALNLLHELVARLGTEGLADGSDPAFQLATTHGVLGQTLLHAYRPNLAITESMKSIALLEGIRDNSARSNLAASLSDLANSYRLLGQLDKALMKAERALEIQETLGRDREVAASLGVIAEILKEQRRFEEASMRYAEASEAARLAGDLELLQQTLQHRASLQNAIGQPARAVELGREALVLCQQSNDTGAEMQACGQLGQYEAFAGHFDAARTWYLRSRELAEQRGDQRQKGIIAGNFASLHQLLAQSCGDEKSRNAHLRRALTSAEESLAIWLDMDDQVFAAKAYCQIGQFYYLLGDFDEAERSALESLAIHERLKHPDIFRDYDALAAILRDRGDDKAADEWQAKHEAKVAELERLRRGPDGGAASVSQQVVGAVIALAQASYEARVQGRALSPDAAEAVAQMKDGESPFPEMAAFFEDVAGGRSPAVPSGLPEALGEVLGKLAEALDEGG